MGTIIPLLMGVAAVACAGGVQQQQVHPDAAGPRPDAGDVSGYCGDGRLGPAEACDDGNLLPGDGCDPQCHIEVCDATTCHTGCCDAQGDCVTGVQDDACGMGGAACEACTDTGGFCYEQSCIANSDCAPGEEMSCGLCGVRTCEANGSWGSCGSEGVCLPDALEVTGSCGNCGQMVRTCSQTCQWGPQDCVGEGLCTPGATELAGECGNCGEERRSCTAQCIWQPWGCAAEGTCPVAGGSCCGGACVDTDTDPMYCGDCGTTCGPNQTCCGGQCANLQTSADHCGSCGNACGTNAQCCTGSCLGYTCVTGGRTPKIESAGAWPADPTCLAGELTVGIITERHWNTHRKYALCVTGAQSGIVQSCSGEVGSCTPAACPAGTVEIMLYIDRNSSGAIPEQQRICVSGSVSGYHTECDGPIGNSNCAPAPCAAGDADLGVILEHHPGVATTWRYRLCVNPDCPPPCP